jgi:acyl carrier protein
MTNDEIKTAVLEALRRVAPEVDTATLRADVPIREQADMDSMDFLNFLQALHASLGVDIPEAAYREVATVAGCVAYIAARNPQVRSVEHEIG